jgi:type VI secretion system protein ImpA
MDFEPIPGLLSPFSQESPGGEDLSFDPVMDDIREARRSDDPTLAQGAWVRNLKQADWGRVIQLCEGLLKDRTKDLQVACWYTEALVQRDGFKGLVIGLKVVEGLMSKFWESMVPRLEDGGMDQRIGRLEWLDATVGAAVREQAMTSPSSGGFSWLRWKESRDVENLGLKDASARETALAEGKLSGEAFDKAVKASGASWFRKVHEELIAATEAFQALMAAADRQMGLDSPVMNTLKESIDSCESLGRTLRARFETMPSPAAEDAGADPGFSDAPSSPQGGESVAAPRGTLASRAQAVARLREAAAYFRTYEPHSPVAPLADRAARWAAMNLDTWLAEVVKDDSVLAQLRTLLDFHNEDQY